MGGLFGWQQSQIVLEGILDEPALIPDLVAALMRHEFAVPKGQHIVEDRLVPAKDNVRADIVGKAPEWKGTSQAAGGRFSLKNRDLVSSIQETREAHPRDAASANAYLHATVLKPLRVMSFLMAEKFRSVFTITLGSFLGGRPRDSPNCRGKWRTGTWATL